MGLCIGVDAHARTCVYKVKDESGSVLGSGTIPSTPAELATLANRYPGATVVLEASGVSEWIYDCLTALGMEVAVCHPANIKRVLGKKNDEIDAEFLVDAYRLKALPLSFMPPNEIRELRQLCRRCAFLTQERTRIKNRIGSKLTRRGVRLLDDETDEAVPDVFVKKRRAKLLEVPDPEIPILVDLLDAIEKKRRDADADVLAAIARYPDVKYLMSIPGVGPLTALAVYAEAGAITRFDDAEALTAYFGLVPDERQSGETRIRGHITRRGSSLVRWLLVQVSWNHVRLCPESSITKVYRKISKRIGKRRAIVGVARRLAKVCYSLLKEKRDFTTSGEPRSPLA